MATSSTTKTKTSRKPKVRPIDELRDQLADPAYLDRPAVRDALRRQGIEPDELAASAPDDAVTIAEEPASEAGDALTIDQRTAKEPSPERAKALAKGRGDPVRKQKLAEDEAEAERIAAEAKAAEEAMTARQKAQRAAARATDDAVRMTAKGARGFHDTIANAPAPPRGSIWLLVAVQLALMLFLLPVNGVPRIAWLWLVLTRHAQLIGETASNDTPAVTATDAASVPNPVSAVQDALASAEHAAGNVVGDAGKAAGNVAGGIAGAVGDVWSGLGKFIP